MAEIGEWEDAEPGVRRRMLQAHGRLMLVEVEFAAAPKDTYTTTFTNRSAIASQDDSSIHSMDKSVCWRRASPSMYRAARVTARRHWSQER